MREKPPEKIAPAAPISLRDVALGELLLLLLLLFYMPAISGGLVFDDDRHITQEAFRSLQGLWRIWFEPGAGQIAYYPVFHTAMWVEYHLWGEGVLGYHLVNIFLHAASACLVVAIMRKLSLPGAWLAAFVFALHPVCVESVAWISEQKNTLSTVFFLGTVLAWLHFYGDRRRKWYLVASGLFLIALLAKATSATLPGVLLVILWWRNGRLDWKRDVLPLLPWFVLGTAGGMLSGSIEHRTYDVQGADFTLTFLQHCLLACHMLWFYAWKLLWPVNLMFNYPRWQAGAPEAWEWLFLLGALAVAGVLCARARKYRGPLAAFLLFAGTLFPVMGFFYIQWFNFSYVSDHFQYVSCLALIVPVTSWLVTAARKLQTADLQWSARVATGLVLAAFCVLTWRQCGLWLDMETFYEKTLESNPESGMTHFNYGLVLVKIPERRAEAMEQFEEGLRLRPNDEKLKNMAAYIFMTSPGMMPQAVSTLQDSVRLCPDDPDAHYMLGSALTWTQGQLPAATAELETALRLKPDYAEAHYMLGSAYAMARRTQDAIAQLQEALRLKSDMQQAKDKLEQVLHPGQRDDSK